jgi:hypothetical protein
MSTTATEHQAEPEHEPAAPQLHSKQPWPARLGSYVRRSPRLHLGAIVVLAILVIVVQLSKVVAVRGLEDDLSRQRAALIEQARAALDAQTVDLLRLSATPLGWAVHAAMLDNSVGDIDIYMGRLIQSKYVRRIALVDPAGVVTASTNLKVKGQPAGAAFPGTDLDTTEPRIDHVDDVIRVVVPVMDFTRRIGTLVFDYSKASITSRLPDAGKP